MRFLLFFMFATKAAAIAIGAKSYSKLSFAYKLLLFQSTLAFIAEAIGFYTGFLHGYNNSAFFNIYLLIDLWLVGYIGKILLSKHNQYHKVIPFALSIVTVIWGYGIYLNGFSVFSHWLLFFGGILQLAIFITLLFHTANNGSKISSQPSFWLSVAIIIFSGSIIPLFGLYDYLVTADVKLMYKLYYINQIAGILRYSLIAVSFIIIARSTNKTINE